MYEWRRDITPQVTVVTISGSVLTIDGTGFGTNIANVKVFLNDNQLQSVTNLTNIQIIVDVVRNPDINSNLSLKVLRADIGIATIP